MSTSGSEAVGILTHTDPDREVLVGTLPTPVTGTSGSFRVPKDRSKRTKFFVFDLGFLTNTTLSFEVYY